MTVKREAASIITEEGALGEGETNRQSESRNPGVGQHIGECGRFLCVSIKGNNSHVKAKILFLLKEIVQDVLSHKVWVQGVVNDFSSPKLHKKRENIYMRMIKLSQCSHLCPVH